MLLADLPSHLLAHTANERGTDVPNGLEQTKLFVSTVHDVKPALFQHLVHGFLLAAFAIRNFGIDRNGLEHLEMQVQAGGFT